MGLRSSHLTRLALHEAHPNLLFGLVCTLRRFIFAGACSSESCGVPALLELASAEPRAPVEPVAPFERITVSVMVSTHQIDGAQRAVIRDFGPFRPG
jgi:hypothetical protein